MKTAKNTSFQNKHKAILSACVQAQADGLPYMQLSGFDMNPVQRSLAAVFLHRHGFVERLHEKVWRITITPLGLRYLAMLNAETINAPATWRDTPETSVWALDGADPGLNVNPHSVSIAAAPYAVAHLFSTGNVEMLADLARRYPAVRMWQRLRIGTGAALLQTGVDLADASQRQYLMTSPQVEDALTRASQVMGVGEQDIKRAAVASFLAELGFLNGGE